jgi:hypothetical protein
MSSQQECAQKTQRGVSPSGKTIYGQETLSLRFTGCWQDGQLLSCWFFAFGFFLSLKLLFGGMDEPRPQSGIFPPGYSIGAEDDPCFARLRVNSHNDGFSQIFFKPDSFALGFDRDLSVDAEGISDLNALVEPDVNVDENGVSVNLNPANETLNDRLARL